MIRDHLVVCLLGLPVLALAQSQVQAQGSSDAETRREGTSARQGSTVRNQVGVPSITGSSVLTADPAKSPVRVPIPPEELGLSWGGFQWFPDLNAELTYDSNLFATRADPVSDWSWTLTPSLVGRSASATHELNLRVGASAQRYQDQFRQNTDDAWADVTGTKAVTGSTTLFGGLGWSRQHEDRGTPDLSFGAEPTVFRDTSAHAGVVQDFGVHYLRLGVAANRLDFDNVATTTPGVTLDNDARDRDIFSVGGRWSWRTAPSAEVFVQGVAEKRDYRRAVDVLGYQRSSDGYRVDVGTAFNVDRHVVGEAYVGVMRQHYDDPRFAPTGDVDLGLDVRWHTSPWTTVWLGLERSLEETVVDGSSGYLSTTGSFRVEHDLNARTLLSGGVSITQDRFRLISRDDDQLSYSAGVRHYLTDGVYVAADYRHHHRTSDVVSANYDRDLFMVSVGTDFGARRRNRYFAYQNRDDSPLSVGVQDFSGFYVGAQLGDGLLQTNSSGPRDMQPDNLDAGELGHLGANMGLFAGYGWQKNRWYAGLELGAQGGGNRLTHDHPNATEPLNYAIDEKSGVSAGVRVGRVLGGGALLYGRYGVTYNKFDNTMVNMDGSFATSQTQRGWQAGVGADVFATSNLFWRLEYLFSRYQDYHLTTTSYDETYRNQSAYLYLGLGWRFGGPSEGSVTVSGAAPSTYDGLYGGVQVGHGAVSTSFTAPSHYHAAGNDTLDANFGAMGVSTGGFVGAGKTWGRWYLGAELDADATRMGWAHERTTNGTGGRDFSVDKRWTYSGSLRFGYVLPQGALLYARLGTARTLFTTRYSRGSSGVVDRDDTLEGTRWGLGLELPVSRSIYMRLDYVATAYDEAVEFTTPGGNPDQLSLLNRDRTFRIGVGVRF